MAGASLNALSRQRQPGIAAPSASPAESVNTRKTLSDKGNDRRISFASKRSGEAGKYRLSCGDGLVRRQGFEPRTR
jgi:hypothetical protein